MIMKKQTTIILMLMLVTFTVTAAVITLSDEIGRHNSNDTKIYDDRDEALAYQESNLDSRILKADGALSSFTYATDKLCELSTNNKGNINTQCEICYSYSFGGNTTQDCTIVPFNNTEADDYNLILSDLLKELDIGTDSDRVWYRERSLKGGGAK